MFRLPSPSLVISMLALVVALGGAGYSATGGNFIIGNTNSASTPTLLQGPIATRTLQVNNGSTAAGATALSLAVVAGHPPMKVNSAVKVTNLNADKLDGLSSAAFARSSLEEWHYIGDPGEPAFANSWVNFDENPDHNEVFFAHASYRVDGLGVVHLRGQIKGGNIGGFIFSLPEAYRPHFHKIFPAASSTSYGEVVVNSVSGIVIAVAGSNTSVSLDGVSFQRASLEE